MTQIDKFKTRVEKIQRLADTLLDRHKTDFIEAVAYDAGFPVKITSVSKRPLLPDYCVRLKFQSSKYSIYSSG